MIKRLFDLVFSSAFLFFSLPLLVGTAWFVRKRLGSPVLFRQTRLGLHARPFVLIKFRSMKNTLNHESDLLSDSDRLTPFGQFLRRTSLDELPTIWNVLRGEISLVGPRPLLEEYLPLYNSEQIRRCEVRPGVTGWAQVNGRNAISWEEKFNLDVWYVDNQSFWLDIKILFLTGYVVLTRKGISAQGEATMSKFKGTVEK